MEPQKRRFLPIVWRATVVLLVVGLLVKWGVVDGYEVRGNSMAPMLRDLDSGADKIMVFKRHFDLFPPARFDLVVFDRDAAMGDGAAGDRFVKRVAGFPGESVLIDGGDLFLTRPNDPPGTVHRAERSIPLLLEMQREVARLDPKEPGAFEVPSTARIGAEVELAADGADRSMIRYLSFLRDDWADENGHLKEGANMVNDVSLHFGVRVTKTRTIVAVELREAADTFVLRLSDRDPARLTRQQGSRREEVEFDPAVSSRLEVGRTHDVQFLNVDNRLIVLVDGRVVTDVTYDRNHEVAGLPGNEPALGIEQGEAAFSDVVVGRDVFYTEHDCVYGVRAPYKIPAGSYFLLGDNSINSRDSRHFGSVPKERFVGRPFLIFHPFGRWRSL